MKIVVLSTNICSIPTCQYLANNHMLKMLASTDEFNPYAIQLEQAATGLNVPFKRFSKAELKTAFRDALTALKPDLVLVFAFGHKIPAELFSIPKHGFYNVHYSLLPRYRGKCPVFWQLKNGDPNGGISIHRVTEEFDAGGLLMQKPVQLIPGATHGIYWGQLSMECVQVAASAIDRLKSPGELWLLPQNEAEATLAPGPQPDDFKISWQNQTANEVENLVNACNPDYGGALTMFRGQLLRLIEVMPAELNMPEEAAPGTIVYADTNYGIFVACKNRQFLKINIVNSNEGFLSGNKLAGLGVRAGEQMVDF